jgi:hypothetical protein
MSAHVNDAPTIPLAVEDRIALEHLGVTVTGHDFDRVSTTKRAARRALDAAYASGWRAGLAAKINSMAGG